MALFRGYENQQGSRSHTALVRSGHMSPAEKWILDPTFLDSSMSSIFKDGVLFNYQYGGPGMEEVVIPKGRVVGVGASVKDYVSKKFLASITLPGMATNGNTIGMAPYNFTKDWFQMDRFGGNQPSIITLDYVQLPYMPGFTAETDFNASGVLKEEQTISVDNRMPWGAVIGECQNGDYLMATPSGRLTKWDGKDYSKVVGQVLASDLNAEPTGWLKWMLWEENHKYDDNEFINRSGASNMPSDEGYPFDPTYAEGNTIFQNYQSRLINNPTGIIGLHDGSGNYDGFGKNDTEYTDMVLEHVSGTDEIVADSTYTVQALDFAGGVIKNLQPGVVVKLYAEDGSDVTATYIDETKTAISYEKGKITLAFIKAVDVSLTIKATYKALHYGTPSWADFKGVQGAMYVLLKK
jgi:hypothetical protein